MLAAITVIHQIPLYEESFHEGASVMQGADVLISHETDKPYEATVYATSGTCTLRGLKIAHRSPSVANNYAVFSQGASLTLEVRAPSASCNL